MLVVKGKLLSSKHVITFSITVGNWMNLITLLYLVAKSMPIYPVWTCTLLDTWATFLYFFVSKKMGWHKSVLVKIPNYYKITHVKMG